MQEFSKTFDLMRRSKDHYENQRTNLCLILSRLNRMRNLHLEWRIASVTKLYVSKQNKRKQKHKNDLTSPHHSILFWIILHASSN